MATKTAPKATVTLPAPVPASVTTRQQRQPRRGRSSGVSNFAAWKSAIDTARVATGYDAQSPIYGKTDIEVLSAVKATLDELQIWIGRLPNQTAPDAAQNYNGPYSTAHDAWNEAGAVFTLVDELLKRKVAKQVAGQTYRQGN